MEAARETGERTDERGIVVPDTDVTLSLQRHFKKQLEEEDEINQSHSCSLLVKVTHSATPNRKLKVMFIYMYIHTINEYIKFVPHHECVCGGGGGRGGGRDRESLTLAKLT